MDNFRDVSRYNTAGCKPLMQPIMIGVNMNLPNMLVTLAQTNDSAQASLFPFPFKFHLIFACIAFVFFAYRFSVNKRPYQLIFAIAIPLSLMIWLSDVKGYFYLIGAIELLLIIAAVITSIVCKPQKDASPVEVSAKKAVEDVQETAEDIAEEVSDHASEE